MNPVFAWRLPGTKTARFCILHLPYRYYYHLTKITFYKLDIRTYSVEYRARHTERGLYTMPAVNNGCVKWYCSWRCDLPIILLNEGVMPEWDMRWIVSVHYGFWGSVGHQAGIGGPSDLCVCHNSRQKAVPFTYQLLIFCVVPDLSYAGAVHLHFV